MGGKTERGLGERKKKRGQREDGVTGITRKLPHQYIGPHTTCFPNITGLCSGHWGWFLLTTVKALSLQAKKKTKKQPWMFPPPPYPASPWHLRVMPDCFPSGSKSNGHLVVMTGERVGVWLSEGEESGLRSLERWEVEDDGQVGGLGGRPGHSHTLLRKFPASAEGACTWSAHMRR